MYIRLYYTPITLYYIMTNGHAHTSESVFVNEILIYYLYGL